MTLYEVLTLFAALLAIVVSTVSLVRGRKIGAMQEELTRISAELAQRQLESINLENLQRSAPQLGLHMTKIGSTGYFVITNTGQGSAFNVDLELIDCTDNPLVSASSLLPCPELKPRSTVKIMTSTHLGSPPRYQSRLTWELADGESNSEVFWVSR